MKQQRLTHKVNLASYERLCVSVYLLVCLFFRAGVAGDLVQGQEEGGSAGDQLTIPVDSGVVSSLSAESHSRNNPSSMTRFVTANCHGARRHDNRRRRRWVGALPFFSGWPQYLAAEHASLPQKPSVHSHLRGEPAPRRPKNSLMTRKRTLTNVGPPSLSFCRRQVVLCRRD